MSEQPLDRLSKAELLSGIRSEYALLEETLAGLSESQMVQPGVILPIGKKTGLKAGYIGSMEEGLSREPGDTQRCII